VERGVTRLVHFTDQRNLSNIEKYGILPIERLAEKDIEHYPNDSYRLDGQLGGISVSITNLNAHLLRSFQRRQRRSWVEIDIDPEVAWTKTCLFYESNAASRKFDGLSDEYLQSMHALTNMFGEKVTNRKGMTFDRTNKAPNQTTDEQAEIMVRWQIPKSKILACRAIRV
jgi:hypothetical protein